MFIDETSTNTKLTKCTGWSPRGERYHTHAPFGSWQTQTFIAGLRHNGLTAPWLVDAPMNAEIFATYIETQLAPTLAPRDIVILDNVPFHKGARIEEIKLVQLGPHVIHSIDWSNDKMKINVTSDAIRHRPAYDEKAELSRNYEAFLHDYYGWPPYWF